MTAIYPTYPGRLLLPPLPAERVRALAIYFSGSAVAAFVGFAAFEIVDFDTLSRVQLAGGLIVLNSMLEKIR